MLSCRSTVSLFIPIGSLLYHKASPPYCIQEKDNTLQILRSMIYNHTTTFMANKLFEPNLTPYVCMMKTFWMSFKTNTVAILLQSTFQEKQAWCLTTMHLISWLYIYERVSWALGSCKWLNPKRTIETLIQSKTGDKNWSYEIFTRQQQYTQFYA